MNIIKLLILRYFLLTALTLNINFCLADTRSPPNNSLEERVAVLEIKLSDIEREVAVAQSTKTARNLNTGWFIFFLIVMMILIFCAIYLLKIEFFSRVRFFDKNHNKA